MARSLFTSAFKFLPVFKHSLYLDFFYIVDNGIGIAIEQQARLFELYVKGDRARYMPGLGMGLYLCQQIILAHGGEIGVDSYPGRGSTF